MVDSIKKIIKILSKRDLVYLSILLLGIIIMSFSQALGVVSVFPFIALVMDPEIVFENRYLLWVYSYFNFSSTESFVIFSGIIMLTLIIITNIFSALTTWFKIRFAWRNNHRLARRLLEKYLSMPYHFFLNQNSSDLSKNVLAEIKSLTNNYIIPLLTMITKGLLIIFIIGTLFLVDVMATSTAIVLLGGAYSLIFFRVNRSLKYRGSIRMDANKRRFKAVNEAFGGIKEIKLMNREAFFLERFSKESFTIARLQSWNAVIVGMPRFALEVFAFGGIIAFVLYLLITSDDARQVIPLAALFAFAGHRLLPAFQEIFGCIATMQFNKAILDRVYDDITTDSGLKSEKLVDIKRMPEKLTFRERINLKDVSYYYPNTDLPVICNIDLSIERKSSVAFVGPTGAGKTTLVDIILGLLIPQIGELTVDNVIISDNNRAEWQMNIGYVPQHLYLSDDKIKNNIAFGVPEKKIDMELVKEAAKISNIDQFITTELPEGYNTLVGERGVRLSGGQRQRIGIARALYHDPGVLVFDEATSALDGATEDAVLQALENASRTKTLIIIAHRLTTVKDCDQIFVIEKGRITASGTYDELLKSCNQFKKMAKL